jgi:hypothetical protein
MASYQKRLRETLSDLSNLGITVDSCEKTGKHVKFKLSYKGGKLCVPRSMTPSDPRGDINWFAVIRRWKRELDDGPSGAGGNSHGHA